MATETSNFKLYLALMTILGAITTYNNLFLASAQTQTPDRSLLSAFGRSFNEPQSRVEDHKWNLAPRRGRKSKQCKINYKHDHLQLALQWAPGVCSTSPKACKHVESKHFTIHGLWPTITGTHEPSNCCFNNTFEVEQLKPLRSDLEEYWFSLFHKTSESFWSHEWLKHGTCAKDVASLRGEVAYFETTLKLTKQLTIYEDLVKAGIRPSKDNQKAIYSSSQILNALKNLTQGHKIQMTCDYEHSQPVPVLTGFNICYNSKLELIDCPEPRGNKCLRNLLFRE